MTRKDQQCELIFKFGLVLRPVLDVIASPEKFSRDERSRIRAQFQADATKFKAEVKEFCREGDCFYQAEFTWIGKKIEHLIAGVRDQLFSFHKDLASRIEYCKPDILKGIGAVPVQVQAAIHESNTPFSTYCRIKTLCETVTRQLTYKDRYLNPSVFHRYLANVPTHAKIMLITWPRAKHGSKAKYDEFLDVSRLFAQENPNRYRLIEHEDIHDRWLQCDGQLYHLGGSIKDAGDSSIYTLSKIDVTPGNVDKLNNLIRQR